MSKIDKIIKEYDEEENQLADEIVSKILNDMTKKQIRKLKGFGYFHFGNGLYIRNNYIYNNKKIIDKVEPDEFSYLVYVKLVKKMKNK